jgi:hypothetical protein
MKYLFMSLTMALSSWAFAGGGQEQQLPEPTGMDNEALWVYSRKASTMPESIVMRISMRDGRRSVMQSATYLEPSPVDSTNFADLDYSDGVEWVEAPSIASDLSPLAHLYTWHHDRNMGYGYYHWYGYDHPYRNYYGVHYDPTPGVRYAYPRRYYRYRPYHYYDAGDLIYRFFRRILD